MTIAPTRWDASYPPSLWGGGAQPRTQVAPGDVVPDSDITSLPPAQWLAAVNDAYVGNPVTAWTTGQSATIATLVVHWAGGSWLDDPALLRMSVESEQEPEPDGDRDQETDPPSDPEPDPEPATTPTKAKKAT